MVSDVNARSRRKPLDTEQTFSRWSILANGVIEWTEFYAVTFP
jgi:hypothetical protein